MNLNRGIWTKMDGEPQGGSATFTTLMVVFLAMKSFGCGVRVSDGKVEGGAYVGPINEVRLRHSLAMGNLDDQKLYGRFLADLIDDFNSRAERPVIRFEPDVASANGLVQISADLLPSTGNLGEGGPANLASVGFFTGGGGLAVGKKVDRSIRLVLDRTTFFDGFLNWDSKGRGGDFSDDRKARILFFHEVGHG